VKLKTVVNIVVELRSNKTKPQPWSQLLVSNVHMYSTYYGLEINVNKFCFSLAVLHSKYRALAGFCVLESSTCLSYFSYFSLITFGNSFF
jgi:hypothetical protein